MRIILLMLCVSCAPHVITGPFLMASNSYAGLTEEVWCFRANGKIEECYEITSHEVK